MIAGGGDLITIQHEIKTQDDIYEAMQCTKSVANEFGYSANLILKLQLVTEEACMNAYEYCGKQKYSSFNIKWHVDENSFEIFVIQIGGLFPLIKKEDANQGARGRGLTLIMNLMDYVSVSQEGPFVVLYIKKNKEE